MAQLPCSPRYGFLCLFVFQDIYQSKAAFLLSECVTKDGLITAVLQCLERVTVGDMCTHEHARTCARVHTHTHTSSFSLLYTLSIMDIGEDLTEC